MKNCGSVQSLNEFIFLYWVDFLYEKKTCFLVILPDDNFLSVFYIWFTLIHFAEKGNIRMWVSDPCSSKIPIYLRTDYMRCFAD